MRPCWARSTHRGRKDTNGRAVPTSYRIEGGSLVQKVTTTTDTAFPVVADPKVSYGWNIYIKFNKTEVKNLKNKVAYADSAVGLCGLLVNPVAAIGCASPHRCSHQEDPACVGIRRRPQALRGTLCHVQRFLQRCQALQVLRLESGLAGSRAARPGAPLGSRFAVALNSAASSIS